MKKLMIAAAIVCAAALSQAATIDWKTGMQIKTANTTPGENYGKFTSTTAPSGSLMIYAFVFDDQASRDAALKLNSGDVWKSYTSGDLAKAADWNDKSTAAGGGTMGVTATVDVGDSWTAGENTTYYAIVLTTLNSDTTTTDPEWYIANVGQTIVNGSGKGTALNNLALKQGGGTGTALTGWTAVPEPTSGLLLLLGVAGLALRRRRA